MGYVDTLRRRGMGAVLALMAMACGDGDDSPAGPEPPDSPDTGIEPGAGCTDGALEHGALFRVCFPASWNGDLVVYAHGYVAPQDELAIPDNIVGGRSVSSLVTELGYAYATTSYRANGLVAADAVDDLLELVDLVEQLYRPDPARTVVVGFSEGGLVATLALERHADRFDGALAGCGPIGDFRAQLDYIDDFRVVFDYFFPGLIPGDAVDVPESVQERWDELYVPAIVLALAAQPDAARQLLRVTGAPADGDDLRSIAETTVGLLWYNVFGTTDAQERLGGQPFDNTGRVYTGSQDDNALNAGVQRFVAQSDAVASIERFSTTGNLTVPLVNLHTTGDPIVPFSQASAYRAKVDRAGRSSRFTQINIERHGHCTFEPNELLDAFALLWTQIERPSNALAGR